MIDLDDKINENKQRNCLQYMLDYMYYCSWDILRENIISCGDSVNVFLEKIENCLTPREINNIVSNYI